MTNDTINEKAELLLSAVYWTKKIRTREHELRDFFKQILKKPLKTPSGTIQFEKYPQKEKFQWLLKGDELQTVLKMLETDNIIRFLEIPYKETIFVRPSEKPSLSILTLIDKL